MAKKHKKVPKLNDEQYYAYIMSLRDEPALYKSDGEAFVPENIAPEKDKKQN